MAIGDTPFVMTLAGLVIFFLAYTAYSRYIDRKVWKPDPSKPTPAHMYTDGVEYFPVSRFVLYGFQWKSIAALGPVLGPGIALTFGWLPALLWILGAALLIGWVQDYSAIFLSVRQEGRSLGPLAYQFLGPRPRQLLLIFLIFYLLLINAAFIFVVATVIDRYSGSFWSFLSLVIAALLTGHLLFRVKMSIVPVTILAIVIQAIGIVAGAFLNPLIKPGALGTAPYTLWLVPIVIILLLGALLPMPRLLTPMNYIAYYSLVPAVVLLVLGALASPITGVTLQQPAFTTFYTPAIFNTGPLWPALFISIACGAISGFHSLVSTGMTAKQIDVETDVRPVGAGAMLTENLVGLTSLAAWVVLSPALKPSASPPFFVTGATTLASPLFGGQFAVPFLSVFYGNFVVGMGMTVLAVTGRFWRVTMSELFSETRASILGNRYVASFLGWLFPILFVLTGSWINIWLYFGGTNQLLAGFALLIVGLFLLSQKRFHWYSTIPGFFMMITTLAAIFWQTMVFGNATITAGVLHPTQQTLKQLGGAAALVGVNGFSTALGTLMFIIGLVMFGYLIRGFIRASRAAPPAAG